MLSIRSTAPPVKKETFDEPDFRGYFVLTKKQAKALGPCVYHGCHEPHLIEALNADELILRSKVKFNLPRGGSRKISGVWVGLNYYPNANFFGPFLIEIPIETLIGRQFMVFRHKHRGRFQYVFVQHDSELPVYVFRKKGGKIKRWRNVKLASYFQKVGGRLVAKNGASYSFVLTEPIELVDCKIQAAPHPWCATSKCRGRSMSFNKKVLRRVARREIRAAMRSSNEIQACLSRFSCLEGQKVTLKRRERSLRGLAIA